MVETTLEINKNKRPLPIKDDDDDYYFKGDQFYNIKMTMNVP